MQQNQFHRSGQKQSPLRTEKYAFRQRHPVLLPLFLLACASILGAVSITGTASSSTDSLFPLFTFMGIPAILPYLSLAAILGISGILTGIIGILEWLDRYDLQRALFPQSKEQSYVNRN
jgi:hypothetical protein